MLWHQLSLETLVRTAPARRGCLSPSPGMAAAEGGTDTAPPAPPAASTTFSSPAQGRRGTVLPPVCGVPPAGLTATGRAPNAHPALPGRAAAARPGGPKGGGAPGGAPDGADSGGAAIPTAGPHRLASPPASAGPAPARPAPSPLSPNASLNFQPRPLPMQQERGQTRSLPAALDPPPRLPAMAARLGLREPQMRGHRRPSRSQAPRRPSPGREGSSPPFQRCLRGQRRRRTLTRGAGAQPRRARAGALTARRRSPAPGAAEKRILRPWGRAAAAARLFPEQGFRGSGSGGCCRLPASSSSPFFSFSRLKKVHLPRGSSSQD